MPLVKLRHRPLQKKMVPNFLGHPVGADCKSVQFGAFVEQKWDEDIRFSVPKVGRNLPYRFRGPWYLPFTGRAMKSQCHYMEVYSYFDTQNLSLEIK